MTPAALGFGWYQLQVFAADRGWASLPIRKPWDYISARIRKDIKGSEFIVIVLTLADGRKIGGAYVDPGFASSYPADEQLLIGQMWDLDPDTGEPTGIVEGSYGLLVDKKDVRFVEFYRRSEMREGTNGDQEDVGAAGSAA